MGSSTAQPPVLGSTLQSVPRCAMAMATNVEGHDSCGTTREEPEDEGQRSEHFAHYGAVGQEAGETFGGQHALEESEAAEEFGHAVEKQ